MSIAGDRLIVVAAAAEAVVAVAVCILNMGRLASLIAVVVVAVVGVEPDVGGRKTQRPT